MAEIVNLNKARKAKKRATRKRDADQNAVTYGLRKADKALAKAHVDKAARALDGKHRQD